MKFIISRYNHDMAWMKDYNADFVIYDRSEVPMENSIKVKNVGSDIYDKFTYIIDNYNNLPDVAIYTKANIFKYITKEEFDKIKDNKTFTPIHTMHHKTVMPIAYYRDDGMYCETNNRWFLIGLRTRHVGDYDKLIGHKWKDQRYKPFSPGSNYILPKENILKYPKGFYEELRSFLDYDVYPGEAFLIERDLYNIWK